MESRIRLFALLYGDYTVLHERLLESLHRAVPDSVPVRLWCNQVGEETRRKLEGEPRRSWSVMARGENIPKYRAMREMFHEIRDTSCNAEWVVWFDDDSWIEAEDWYPVMQEVTRPSGVCYVGEPWGIHYLPGQWDFIRAAPWFRGKDPPLHEGRPVVWFAQGAYWWLRTDVLRAIDWPDPRLSHNGGDSLLGEAVRQQGFTLTPCAYGVRVNDSPRRGIWERPAGAKEGMRE
jgi:hypothetical protein